MARRARTRDRTGGERRRCGTVLDGVSGGRSSAVVALVVLAALAATLASPAPPARGADEAPPPRTPAQPAGNAPAPSAPPRPVAPSADAVDHAVALGRQWLRGRQDGDGGFGSSAGETALALWALRATGGLRTDPEVVRAASRLARDIPDGTTYGTSLGIIALLANDPVRHRDRAQKALDALVAGRCENGQWSYLARGRRRNVGDNSNTQCAALALGAARAHGLKVPPEAWKELLAFATRTVNEDGGWGYSEKQQRQSYGSMTAGMAMSWTLARAAVDDVAPEKAAAPGTSPAAKARDWLGARFDARDPPGLDEWRIYWLWSVERAATVAKWDRLGTRDWYAEGAARLVATQNAKGCWIDSRPVADTAWALLFLRRGTEVAITPSEAQTATTTPGGGPEKPK